MGSGTPIQPSTPVRDTNSVPLPPSRPSSLPSYNLAGGVPHASDTYGDSGHVSFRSSTPSSTAPLPPRPRTASSPPNYSDLMDSRSNASVRATDVDSVPRPRRRGFRGLIDRVGEVVSGAYQAVRMNPSKANKVLLGGAVAGIVGLGTAVVGGVLLATGWGGIFGWLLLGGGAATAVVGGIAVIIALILRRKASYE